MKEIFMDTKKLVNLRQKNTIQTFNVKTVYMGTETISHRGPQIWAMVPNSIKQAKSLSAFKAKIKEWKPEGCKCRLCKTYIAQVGFIN